MHTEGLVSVDEDGPDSSYETATFQADSALIRELGERLVGQPHIALAELIKNAYDADATLCTVEFASDSIIVTDNGHGMSETEFLGFWMRIGTRNKQDQPLSREFSRPITGSKGVGRLSAQFLAHGLKIITSAKQQSGDQLTAFVDWDEAVDAGELTKAKARYRVSERVQSFAGGSRHGTKVVMRLLKQTWGETAYSQLAQELWMIQPPLADQFSRLLSDQPEPDAFRIELVGPNQQYIEAFKAQMHAALENWDAVIQGKLQRAESTLNAHVSVMFRDGDLFSETFEVDPLVNHAKWQIRVFRLQGRQFHGIKVTVAREYFEKFGGVQVYDAGFRLPYYGVKQDWLNIEYDHSHRRNRSALLPDRLHVRRALNDLPTQGRLFGIVRINTGKETKEAGQSEIESGEFLKIQVTRDRLVGNKAYAALRDAVRWSLDYYATRQRIREEQRTKLKRPKESPDAKFTRLQKIMEDVRDEIPSDLFSEIEKEFSEYSKSVRLERDADDAARALLGPLAASGMAALAIEHETQKEMRIGRALARKVRRLAKVADNDEKLVQVADDLNTWIDRMESMRRLFSPMLDAEDREAVESLQLHAVLEQTISNVSPLMAKVAFSTGGVPRDFALPAATLAEWTSLFQNVFINASNAMLDSDDPKIQCLAGRTGRATWVRISDTGIGMDLTEADELFEPFNRRARISEERQALGLGGMGLGLTIVRMISASRNCAVRFVEPEVGFSTTFQMSWST